MSAKIIPSPLSPRAAFPPAATPSATHWVALGDSFTAGTSESEPTWPRLVLERAAVSPRLRLDNLARAGATVAEVRAEQLPAAIAAQPELVTSICGGNDVIGSVRPSFGAVGAELDALWRTLRAELPGAELLTCTYPAIGPAALRPRTRRRVEHGLERLNVSIRAVAAAHGVHCLELAEHPGHSDHGNYAEDGIHPSASGHREAAAVFGPPIEEAVRRLEASTANEEER